MADQASTYSMLGLSIMQVTKQKLSASDKAHLLCALPTAADIAPHRRGIYGMLHRFATHSRSLLVKQSRRLR